MTDAAAEQPDYAVVLVGDPAPWFIQRSTTNPRYALMSAGGRYLVLGFFGSTSDEQGRKALSAIAENRPLFDDDNLCFFGVSIDPVDHEAGRLRESVPGIRYFLDFDASASRLYGAVPRNIPANGQVGYRRFWIVLDPTLRVQARFAIEEDNALFSYLRSLPPPDRFAGFEVPPPILVLPNVFEPEFCRKLVELYDAQGGEESGFMREMNGKTVAVSDHAFKRRKDFNIEDEVIKRALQQRIVRRVNPEIEKIYSFKVTRMERYIVGCYAAEDGAHFSPHRDNTTKGTAHRRFAVSINLNSEFEGGEVSFPEYSRRGYKAPIGGAVIFPCALLHAVSKVTRGARYAFLPFLYDDAAAKIREDNNRYLEAGTYKASDR